MANIHIIPELSLYLQLKFANPKTNTKIMRRITVFIKFVLLSVSMVATFASAQTFQLNSDGYFNAGVKNKGLVPVSHKNIIFPAFGKEQTAKGGVWYEDRMFSRWL